MEIKSTIEIWKPYMTDMCIKNGMVCGIERLIFTLAVSVGLDGHYSHGRFCFDTLQNARGFLSGWEVTTYPVVGEGGCNAIKGTLI